MMNAVRSWFLSPLVVTCCLVSALKAQEVCQPPAVVTAPPGANIFTEQQEIDLGDILAERMPRYVRITDDKAVTAYLARIGERLAQHLPPTQLRFRYYLVDLRTPEAFSIAGGRIYVARRMITFVRNEDELASVIAHEMGHIVTHQTAIDMTALLTEVLGVSAVSDRQDILRKYDELEESWRRNRGAFRRVGKRQLGYQLIADQVGVYALASAGYSPQCFVDIFDRTAQTGGKTGDWLTDFFHITNPDQIRLRQMLKSVENMPQVCIAPQPANASEDFEKWRSAVRAFQGWSRRAENLHGVLAKVKLDPFIRRDIQNLKFSPDGEYILAQQGDTIYVLTREPFTFLFQIHAPEAWNPQFTSDSKSVAFTDGGARVEVWDLARQTRARVDQPSIEKGCLTTSLAPDAKTLACLGRDESISLIDLASGTAIMERRGFVPYIAGRTLGFSPDGRYFLAPQQDSAWVVDLRTREEIRLPSKLKERLANGFVFLGPNRLLVGPNFKRLRGMAALNLPTVGTVWTDSPHVERQPATLLDFPSGRVIDHIPLAFHRVSAPAHGDYLVLRPVNNYAVGVMDLKTKKILVAAKQEAFDIYDDTFVHQRAEGDLGLYEAKNLSLRANASLPLPTDSSGEVRAFISPGLKWLAVSGGPIWDLATGKTLYHLRPFQSGWFEGESAFYADFPKLGDTPRTITRVDLTRQDVDVLRKVEDPYAWQSGPFLVVSKPQPSGGLGALLNPCYREHPDHGPLECNVVDEVSDVRTGTLLWSRRFPREHPGLLVEPGEGRALLRWRVQDEAGREELKNYPELSDRLAARKDNNGIYLVEILDALTGKALAAQLVESGGRGWISTVGDRLFVSHQGYTEIYSVGTGQKEGELLGWPRAHCQAANLVSVRGEGENELAVYDLNRREKLDEFAFASDVDFDQFSTDGKRLIVLTADQTAYLLDVSNRVSPNENTP